MSILSKTIAVEILFASKWIPAKLDENAIVLGLVLNGIASHFNPTSIFQLIIESS